MCYVVYISTSSSEDLTQLPTDQYWFQLLDPTSEDDNKAASLLQYVNKYYLTSFGGCSCLFRHWSANAAASDPYFGPPEGWSPEEPEAIDCTRAVYDVFERLVSEGSRVDILDFWNNELPETIETLPVALSDVDRDSFRFFQNVRFDLVA